MSRTYTCDDCGGTFEPEWSEEEAQAEKKALWGDVPNDECAVVCDDCWQKYKPENNPELYADYLASLN